MPILQLLSLISKVSFGLPAFVKSSSMTASFPWPNLQRSPRSFFMSSAVTEWIVPSGGPDLQQCTRVISDISITQRSSHWRGEKYRKWENVVKRLSAGPGHLVSEVRSLLTMLLHWPSCQVRYSSSPDSGLSPFTSKHWNIIYPTLIQFTIILPWTDLCYISQCFCIATILLCKLDIFLGQCQHRHTAVGIVQGVSKKMQHCQNVLVCFARVPHFFWDTLYYWEGSQENKR